MRLVEIRARYFVAVIVAIVDPRGLHLGSGPCLVVPGWLGYPRWPGHQFSTQEPGVRPRFLHFGAQNEDLSLPGRQAIRQRHLPVPVSNSNL